MTDFPRSLLEFQQRFPDEEACAAYLAILRWPAGFVCPACGSSRGWALATKAYTHECADCRKQTSVTAGTVMHGSKLALIAWFWAAYLMATHSNGISALQLQKQLGLGSYKTAWLLATKLRRAMVAPERMPLAGLVEVDESLIACRSKDEPPSGGGRRSHQGKLLVAGAVEVGEGGPGRIRLARIEDFSADSLHAFLGANLAPGATARPTAGPATPARPASHTTRTSSETWPPIWSCPGFIASSPTSRPGRWASTTASDANTCNPTSTSSSSASTGAEPATQPSAPSSASASQSSRLPTRC